MTLEGLLFAAFGAAASGKVGDALAPMTMRALLCTMPVAGILAACFAWKGIDDARAAAQDLKNVYGDWRVQFGGPGAQKEPIQEKTTEPVFVRPFSSRGAVRGTGLVSLLDTAQALPVLLAISWVVISLLWVCFRFGPLCFR